MIVTFSRDNKYPKFTLGTLLINKDSDELIFGPTRNLLKICEVRLKIESDWDAYSNIIKSSKNFDELCSNWTDAGQDLDLDLMEPMKFPPEFSEAIKYACEHKLGKTDTIIKLCESVGIKLDYVNLENEVNVISNGPSNICTRKMLSKFPHLLMEISRVEFINIVNKFGKSAAIRTSNNKYYTRK